MIKKMLICIVWYVVDSMSRAVRKPMQRSKHDDDEFGTHQIMVSQLKSGHIAANTHHYPM